MQACVAFIWNVAEGICILTRGGRRGIHPGACVGVDLVLWLGFLTASLMYLFFGYSWFFSHYEYFYGSAASTYVGMNRACIAFGFLET